jgi:class 3 adenylate cyclase
MQTPLWSTFMLLASKMIFPAAILIAATRNDLLDIDRLFGSTVMYNVLAAIALGLGFLLVPRVADALTAGLDLDRTVGQTSLTLLLAVVVLMSGRKLRPVVERWFFRERFALQQAMRELPEQFAAVRSADQLWELTGGELTRLVRPSICVIYTTAGHALLPAFVSDEARAPSAASNGSLARLATGLGGAHRIDRKDESRLDAADRALLQELEAQIIVPVHRKGALEALIVLGEKRSGDIYTATDLALLTALGKTLSSHMLRFDEAELLSRAHTLQEKMRRYVPGALADAIAEGEELETGEREVSVLFVDIRGYTAYADGREAREIFSTVNRYTEAVSSIVRQTGGVVVEFNGDGMMAVFGAPRALAHKEAAAVECAVRLANEIPLLGATDTALAVGVGVATGIAFVGNIEAVDRTIWSAIGSTTNLAARLQSLTKERQARVLIDGTTHTRAQAVAGDFISLGNESIRGVSMPVTLYALPAQYEASASGTASATAVS